MATVTFDHVTKRFGQTVAVNDLTLEVPDKEFLVLVGPSGCGKSTALRMLAGLETVTEGRVYIGDRLVNDIPAKDRDIAMVFQSYALYPHMTVYHNLAFGLSLRKFKKPDIDERVRRAATTLDIEPLLDRKPVALSGGQRQRVALGRAIVREPAVFLMDEPLSNLDAKLRVQTRAELVKLQQRLETTTIYVTHDQVEAMTMGGRIAVLNFGVLQQLDTPQNLYNKPSNLFVAGFMGSPAMNFFDGRIVKADGAIACQVEGVQLRFEPDQAEQLESHLDEEVVFGIRPEHITDRRLLRADEQHENILLSRIDVTEPLGNETFLYLVSTKTDRAKAFIARVSGEEPVRPGEEIEAAVNMAHAHVFEKEFERAIF